MAGDCWRKLTGVINGGNGVYSREVIWLGNIPIAQVRNVSGTATLYWIHADPLGTPRVITDNTGATVWQRTQEPLGENDVVSNPAGAYTNLRFDGQFTDTLTGLSYNLMRDYDPSIGRYTTADPIGIAGGLNRYGYGMNNPLAWTDPTGEFVPLAVGAWETAPYWGPPLIVFTLHTLDQVLQTSKKDDDGSGEYCDPTGGSQKPPTNDPCQQDPSSEECRNKSSYEDALTYLKAVGAKNYRKDYKISQDGKEIYRIDRSHNDIEVYSRKTGFDKGSIDPKTGRYYRGSQGKEIPRWVK